MISQELNNVEVTSPAGVRHAARDFAAALAETPQFAAFVAAAERLKIDSEAQKAIEAFETRQQSLQMMLRLNAVSPEDRAELERLHLAFLAEPTVKAYLEAQTELTSLCLATAEMISRPTGLDYATACGASCCG